MKAEPRRPDTPFWVEPDAVGDEALRLDAEESHHLLHVFRAAPGAPFEAVDGAGHLYTCELAGVEAGRAVGRILSREADAGELPGALELLVGQPDFRAAEELVSRAVPLGVARIAFVATERSERWLPTGARTERLLRLARASLKQSRRTRLPEIVFGEVFEGVPGIAGAAGDLRVLADPAGRRWSGIDPSGVFSAVKVAIGPPGGLTPAERAFIESRGFVPISLGNNRLRTEDAACALLALAREGILARAPGRH